MAKPNHTEDCKFAKGMLSLRKIVDSCLRSLDSKCMERVVTLLSDGIGRIENAQGEEKLPPDVREVVEKYKGKRVNLAQKGCVLHGFWTGILKQMKAPSNSLSRWRNGSILHADKVQMVRYLVNAVQVVAAAKYLAKNTPEFCARALHLGVNPRCTMLAEGLKCISDLGSKSPGWHCLTFQVGKAIQDLEQEPFLRPLADFLRCLHPEKTDYKGGRSGSRKAIEKQERMRQMLNDYPQLENCSQGVLDVLALVFKASRTRRGKGVKGRGGKGSAGSGLKGSEIAEDEAMPHSKDTELYRCGFVDSCSATAASGGGVIPKQREKVNLIGGNGASSAVNVVGTLQRLLKCKILHDTLPSLKHQFCDAARMCVLASMRRGDILYLDTISTAGRMDGDSNKLASSRLRRGADAAGQTGMEHGFGSSTAAPPRELPFGGGRKTPGYMEEGSASRISPVALLHTLDQLARPFVGGGRPYDQIRVPPLVGLQSRTSAAAPTTTDTLDSQLAVTRTSSLLAFSRIDEMIATRTPGRLSEASTHSHLFAGDSQRDGALRMALEGAGTQDKADSSGAGKDTFRTVLEGAGTQQKADSSGGGQDTCGHQRDSLLRSTAGRYDSIPTKSSSPYRDALAVVCRLEEQWSCDSPAALGIDAPSSPSCIAVGTQSTVSAIRAPGGLRLESFEGLSPGMVQQTAATAAAPGRGVTPAQAVLLSSSSSSESSPWAASSSSAALFPHPLLRQSSGQLHPVTDATRAIAARGLAGAVQSSTGFCSPADSATERGQCVGEQSDGENSSICFSDGEDEQGGNIEAVIRPPQGRMRASIHVDSDRTAKSEVPSGYSQGSSPAKGRLDLPVGKVARRGCRFSEGSETSPASRARRRGRKRQRCQDEDLEEVEKEAGVSCDVQTSGVVSRSEQYEDVSAHVEGQHRGAVQIQEAMEASPGSRADGDAAVASAGGKSQSTSLWAGFQSGGTMGGYSRKRRRKDA